jgi:Lectin C-type domain/Dockerin type I domain
MPSDLPKSRNILPAAIVASILIASHQAAAARVQWRISDGGNGHWYELRPKVGDWFACRAEAIALGGDLACITSAQEQAFIAPLLPLDQWPSWNRIFIGGYQDAGAPPNAGWHWVDGTPWSYTNWYGNQPNGGEGFLTVKRDSGGSYWDDYPSNSSDIPSYLAEWPSTCPADLTEDGKVSGADLGQLLLAWGEAYGSAADLNQDGVVDGSDLSALINAWGPCQN